MVDDVVAHHTSGKTIKSGINVSSRLAKVPLRFSACLVSRGGGGGGGDGDGVIFPAPFPRPNDTGNDILSSSLAVVEEAMTAALAPALAPALALALAPALAPAPALTPAPAPAPALPAVTDLGTNVFADDDNMVGGFRRPGGALPPARVPPTPASAPDPAPAPAATVPPPLVPFGVASLSQPFGVGRSSILDARQYIVAGCLERA